MKSNYFPGYFAFATLLTVLCASGVDAQNPNGRRPPLPAAQGQAMPGQALAIGDAVEIQSADGSWIRGTIRNVDPATAKYEVVLVNSMTGWAPASSLRRAQAAAAPPQVMPQIMPAAAPIQQVAPAPASPALCNNQPSCVDVSDFAAVVSSFRLSNQGAYKIIDTTIRFVNKTVQPVVLGYVDGSGLIIDDRGNRFGVRDANTIRGLGVVRGNTHDPKFVLQPGGSGDAQFQFFAAPEIIGSAFELGLTIRELVPAGATQYTLGAEFPLQFNSVGQTVISAAPAGSPVGQPPAATAFAPQAGAVQAAPVPVGAAQPGAAAPAKGKRALFGLSQAASMIPGMGGAANTAQAAGTATGTAGQAAPAGANTANLVSQIASAGSAFAPTAGATGTAPAGGASGVLSQASAMIPGFSSSPGQGASGVISQAATMIPGFSTPPPGAVPVNQPAAMPLNPVAPGAVAPAVATDPCAGRQHCFKGGSFAADVIQLAGNGGANNDYTVRVRVMFRNLTAQPVALAYVAGSGVVSDNAGNRYAPTMTGTTEQTAQGIGAVQGAQADGRFLMAPGRAGQAMFVLTRRGPAAITPGTAFNLSFAVAEVVNAGGQIRPGPQHGVSLANLTCACGAAPAARPVAPGAKPAAAPGATAPAAAAPTTPGAAIRNALGKKN